MMSIYGDSPFDADGRCKHCRHRPWYRRKRRPVREPQSGHELIVQCETPEIRDRITAFLERGGVTEVARAMGDPKFLQVEASDAHRLVVKRGYDLPSPRLWTLYLFAPRHPAGVPDPLDEIRTCAELRPFLTNLPDGQAEELALRREWELDARCWHVVITRSRGGLMARWEGMPAQKGEVHHRPPSPTEIKAKVNKLFCRPHFDSTGRLIVGEES